MEPMLTVAERDRLVQLIDVQNTATQVDHDESEELRRLIGKLFDESPDTYEDAYCAEPFCRRLAGHSGAHADGAGHGWD